MRCTKALLYSWFGAFSEGLTRQNSVNYFCWNLDYLLTGVRSKSFFSRVSNGVVGGGIFLQLTAGAISRIRSAILDRLV